MVLKENELISIKGGGVNYAIFVGIGGLVTLIVGIIDGYFRPLKCNK